MTEDVKLPPYIYGREAGQNEKVWTAEQVRVAILAERVSRWMPIETAPKDGPILAYNSVQGVYETRFDRGEWPHADWFSDDKGRMPGIWYPRPTHWMPLPAPPSAEEISPKG